MRVVVVGGGIVGASAAYHLSRGTSTTDVEVVVIDQAHIGRATPAGAGIVCPWVSGMPNGPLFDLYAAGASYYSRLIPELADSESTKQSIGYRRVGALVVTADEHALAAAHHRTQRRAVGRPEVGRIERITNAEARDLFPPLRSGLEAIRIGGAARVDGRLLTEAMLKAASAERVGVRPGAAELMLDGDAVTGVIVDDEVVAADRVIVAGGAWTNQVLQPIQPGFRVDVEPQKGQIIHLDVDAETAEWPVLMPIGGHYLVGFDDRRIVIGATRETGSGFDTRVTAGGHAEVLGAALDVAPGLADARIIETRVGLRPMADGVPTVGRPPGVDGLVIGTGMGAGGLTMGPLCGRLLAEIALDRPPSFDVEPYRPRPNG